MTTLRVITHEPNDAELIAGAVKGDEDCFRRLYEKYFDQVYRVAARMGGNLAEPEDIAQEAFTVAYRGLPSFRGEAKFSTWLYRITLFVAARHRRRAATFGRFRRRYKAEPPTTPSENAEQALVRRETEVLVRQVLGSLDEKKRAVLVCFEIEGLPGEEIAELLDCPVDTVWSRLHHARRAFAKRLRQLQNLEEMKVNHDPKK